MFAGVSDRMGRKGTQVNVCYLVALRAFRRKSPDGLRANLAHWIDVVSGRNIRGKDFANY